MSEEEKWDPELKRKPMSDYTLLIEERVSRWLNRPWKFSSAVKPDMGSMHDALYLEGTGFDAFVKMGNRSFSRDQFRQEALGLKYLEEVGKVPVPQVIDVIDVEEQGSLLLMEAVKTKPPETDKDWEVLGRGLAAIHKNHADYCGLHMHSYVGIFRQDNDPSPSWCKFYGEMRLIPQMEMAEKAGHMTPGECNLIEKIVARLPALYNDPSEYSLLHGDAWPGNLLFDGEKMTAIDCSIYYGERELDLSTSDIFKPAMPGEGFYRAYDEIYPIEPGYEERKELWRLHQWLGHVTLFGDKFKSTLMNSINMYL